MLPMAGRLLGKFCGMYGKRFIPATTVLVVPSGLTASAELLSASTKKPKTSAAWSSRRPGPLSATCRATVGKQVRPAAPGGGVTPNADGRVDGPTRVPGQPGCADQVQRERNSSIPSFGDWFVSVAAD